MIKDYKNRNRIEERTFLQELIEGLKLAFIGLVFAYSIAGFLLGL